MTNTLYFNGDVLTMDARNSVVEAVLTQGGKILAAGDEATLRMRMPEDTRQVDLQGRCMMPAFIDPHGHFPDPGVIRLFRVDLASAPRGDCPDIPTALARLRQKASETPHGDWVFGVLFDNTAIAERRMPTRSELDSVSESHPIWVLHASGHNGVANTMALARHGVHEDTPNPTGGRFGRDSDTGALNGLIEGISAMGEMGETDFLVDRDRFWQGFASTREEYLSHGVTYAQNAWASRKTIEHFASLPADEDPGIDIEILPVGELEPDLSGGRGELTWPGNPHFTLGARKLFTDGAFQLQTAFLSAPYHVPANSEAPCGMAYVEPAQHNAEVRLLHDLGLQIHCHCNGDAGVDLFLDAVDAAQSANPRTDHRHTVIHGQAVRDDQLCRMKQLGVTISFFSAHIHFWGDRHMDTILGPERASRISPTGSAERIGVRFTIHNDASVTPTRPLHLAHCAVNRLSSSGQLLDDNQKISVLSALRAQTIDAAWQVFQDQNRGSIEPGKLADFAILDRNPVGRPSELSSARVIATIRRDLVVFQQKQERALERVN